MASLSIDALFGSDADAATPAAKRERERERARERERDEERREASAGRHFDAHAPINKRCNGALALTSQPSLHSPENSSHSLSSSRNDLKEWPPSFAFIFFLSEFHRLLHASQQVDCLSTMKLLFFSLVISSEIVDPFRWLLNHAEIYCESFSFVMNVINLT